jgi:soluble lytic murein transglycosylase-like protein
MRLRRASAMAAVCLVALAASPSKAEPDPRALYRSLIETESARAGLPPEVAEAVMAVESGYDPAARGAAGEVGLMQIMPGTARMLGFFGSDAELAAPETNIRLGVRYLAGAWRLAAKDICTAAMKYRAGHGETRFSRLSVNYCLAVRGKLAALGYPVTGEAPVATFGADVPARVASRAGRRSGAGGCRGLCIRGSTGGADLADLNDRFAAMVASAKLVKLQRR